MHVIVPKDIPVEQNRCVGMEDNSIDNLDLAQAQVNVYAMSYLKKKFKMQKKTLKQKKVELDMQLSGGIWALKSERFIPALRKEMEF